MPVLRVLLASQRLHHALHRCYTAETYLIRRARQELMKGSLWRHLRQRLSTQVVIMMVALLVITTVAGFAVVGWNLKGQLADDPSVVRLVDEGHPGGPAQQLAAQVVKQTHAVFVVMVDKRGIRLTHPKPWLIGMPINYPDAEPEYTEPFRTGIAWMGIQHGSLGWEAVGKVPVWDR